MKKNKRGFTLIEILAAITILGIITGIAYVSISNIIGKGKQEHYKTAEDSMTLAGQTYAQTNRDVLPKAVGQKTKVYLSTLVEKKYIQPISDYNNKDCNLTESYVEIYKYSQNDYTYTAYLKCPNYSNEKDIEEKTPNIEAEFIIDEENSKADAKVTFTGNEKLKSYSYIIYKGTKEIKNTGNVMVKGNKENLTINIPLTNYTPGNIKIVLNATNNHGNNSTKTIIRNIADTKKPTCIIKLEDNPSSEKEWTKDARKITVGCEDGDGTGCVKEVYEKTFRTTTKIGKITIMDNSGNKTDCDVSVYVDTTPPTCEVSGGNSTWINKTSSTTSRKITATCTDEESDCKVKKLEHVYSTNINTETAGAQGNNNGGIVEDNVGNTTTCKADQIVKIDKTPPTCKVSGGSTSWINKNSNPGSRTITAKCSDTGGSNCATADFSKTYSSNIDTTTAGAKGNNSGGSVKDNAGNVTNCKADQTVKIDKTPPTCNVSGGSTSWINKNSNPGSRTITAKCSDTGGSKCATSDFSKTYTSDINTSTAGAVGNSSGGSVKDYAGNTTTCKANQTVKIDKTPPTITCNASNASVKYCDKEVLTSKSGCTAYGKLPTKSCSGTTSNTVFSAGGGGYIASRTTTHCDDTGNCTSPNWKKSSGRCVSAYCTTKVTGKVCDDAGNCVTQTFTYYLKY